MGTWLSFLLHSGFSKVLGIVRAGKRVNGIKKCFIDRTQLLQIRLDEEEGARLGSTGLKLPICFTTAAWRGSAP